MPFCEAEDDDAVDERSLQQPYLLADAPCCQSRQSSTVGLLDEQLEVETQAGSGIERDGSGGEETAEPLLQEVISDTDYYSQLRYGREQEESESKEVSVISGADF